jgi:hypothetical protein
VRGVSTRDMGSVTEALLGKRVSRSTVSRVTRRLDDAVEALRTEPIAEPITYLYLDATFIDARWARTVENVSALVAASVRTATDDCWVSTLAPRSPKRAGPACSPNWSSVGCRACASSSPMTMPVSGRPPASRCRRRASSAVRSTC